MAVFVALLRAVNLAGHGAVGMADLRRVAEGLGLDQVRTVLQTGNLVFEADGSATSLETRLEGEIARQVDLKTDIMVRTATQIGDLVQRNPFPKEATTDPGHLVVVFLKAALAKDAVDRLRQAIKGPEEVMGAGRELYLTYPAGIGKSKVTMQLIERHTGCRGTGRNWNTLTRLVQLCGDR